MDKETIRKMGGRTASAPVKAPALDLAHASPEEIKAEIARTRAHMDERLSQLGRKLKPQVKPAYLWLSLTALALGVGGYMAFRKFRAASIPEKWDAGLKKKLGKIAALPTVEKAGALSGGILDQLGALRLAYAAVRHGKPSIYVVKPRKT